MLSQTLVNSSDLVAWAAQNSAADHLPMLIRRLICATVSRADLISFPAEEGVHIGGWDGVVETQQGNTFVPTGLSVWEMGKKESPGTKADEDYTKRTANPDDVNPAETTFVFITPRRWKGKAAWISKRRAEKVWKDVCAYDADDLMTWLETAPSVHIWLSWMLGKRPDGAEDLERFWHNWSQVTNPPMASEILIAGREEVKTKLLSWLEGGPAPLGLHTDTQEEAMGILVAVIETLPPRDRAKIFARAVVADDPPAFRHLVGQGKGLVLVPKFSDPALTIEAVRAGHHVLIALARDATSFGDTISAPRLRREPIEQALIASGMERERAVASATLARRSLTAFRRSLSVVPGFKTPPWAEPQSSRQILPALLIGQWRDDVEGDREIVAQLAGVPYEEVCEKLSQWMALPDTPVRRIGNIWMLVSKEDAWRLIAPHLTSRDLETFWKTALSVLGEIDPAWDLEPDRRYMANILGKQVKYSPLLCKAVADTLAALAARSSAIQKGVANVEVRTQNVVRELLGAANKDWRLWASLSHVLPLLAEAAPEEFLEGITLGVDVILPLFANQGDIMFSPTPHTGILWALEALAWNPDLVGQVALSLAVLARQDPGATSNQGNRPFNSLKDIFLCWYPQTSAPFDQRLSIIDTLRAREPEIAWRLLPTLIVQPHSVASKSSTPKWRDWAPEGEPSVFRSELYQSASEAVSRLLADVGTSGERWKTFLNEYSDVSPEDRERIVNRLTVIDLADFHDDDVLIIRNTIDDMVARHREFPDADWSLPAEEVDRLAVVAERFIVSDPVARNLWLFGSYPHLPDVVRKDNYEEHETELGRRRVVALEEVTASGGVESIRALIEKSESPGIVGQILGKNDLLSEEEMNALLSQCLDWQNSKLQSYGYAYIVSRFDRYGWSWADTKLGDESILGRDSIKRAAFYLALPHLRSTWERLEKEEEKTRQEYWSRWYSWRLDEQDVYEYVVLKLIEFGNPLTAIHILNMRGSTELPVPEELCLEVLKAALTASIDSWTRHSGIIHDIPDLLDKLAASKNTNSDELMMIEWHYLPLLDQRRNPKLLHARLARDPEFFMEAVQIAYKPRHGEREELSEEESHRASMVHKMLWNWRTIPGTDENGAFSSEELFRWATRVREVAVACDRAEITDQLIGQVLTFAPVDEDGAWPHSVVRSFVETIASEHVERGFEVQVFNNRGITSRNPIDGGSQERAIAERYEREARSMRDRWPRTATMLRRLAASYRHDAEREDLSAEFTEDTWS